MTHHQTPKGPKTSTTAWKKAHAASLLAILMGAGHDVGNFAAAAVSEDESDPHVYFIANISSNLNAMVYVNDDGKRLIPIIRVDAYTDGQTVSMAESSFYDHPLASQTVTVFRQFLDATNQTNILFVTPQVSQAARMYNHAVDEFIQIGEIGDEKVEGIENAAVLQTGILVASKGLDLLAFVKQGKGFRWIQVGKAPAAVLAFGRDEGKYLHLYLVGGLQAVANDVTTIMNNMTALPKLAVQQVANDSRQNLGPTAGNAKAFALALRGKDTAGVEFVPRTGPSAPKIATISAVA